MYQITCRIGFVFLTTCLIITTAYNLGYSGSDNAYNGYFLRSGSSNTGGYSLNPRALSGDFSNAVYLLNAPYSSNPGSNYANSGYSSYSAVPYQANSDPGYLNSGSNYAYSATSNLGPGYSSNAVVTSQGNVNLGTGIPNTGYSSNAGVPYQGSSAGPGYANTGSNYAGSSYSNSNYSSNAGYSCPNIKLPCPKLQECDNVEKIKFATDFTTCYVFLNKCYLENENCERRNRRVFELFPVPGGLCKMLCRDFCPNPGQPVCAQFRGVKQEFRDACVLNYEICRQGIPFELVNEGKCKSCYTNTYRGVADDTGSRRRGGRPSEPTDLATVE